MPGPREITLSQVRSRRKKSKLLAKEFDASIRARRGAGRTKVEWILLDALWGAVRNPRTHSKKQIRQIADSIEKFGFINPIIIAEHDRIIAGHGRFEAAKLLRLKEVPVISEAAIRAYMLAPTTDWPKRPVGIANFSRSNSVISNCCCRRSI